MQKSVTEPDGLVARALARLRVPSVLAFTPTAPDLTTPPATPPPPDVDTILGMPLEDFGRRHLAVRVRLPDGATCWFVSGADEVAVLRGEGIERGAIWTARELADVVGAGWTRETIGRLIAIKRTFEGVVEDTPMTRRSGRLD